MTQLPITHLPSQAQTGCIFCQLWQGSADWLWQGEAYGILADRDPQAQAHYLIISRIHLANWLATETLDSSQASQLQHELVLACNWLTARYAQGTPAGFRLLTNNGEAAGQTIQHLHWHWLAGESLGPVNSRV